MFCCTPHLKTTRINTTLFSKWISGTGIQTKVFCNQCTGQKLSVTLYSILENWSYQSFQNLFNAKILLVSIETYLVMDSFTFFLHFVTWLFVQSWEYYKMWHMLVETQCRIVRREAKTNLYFLNMGGFICTFWCSLSSTSSILE